MTSDAFARELRRIVLEQSKRANVGHIGSALLEPGRLGSEAYLNEMHGLSAEQLVATCASVASVRERL